jgi:RimJ/RimL family protein N-acetyltransferase
VADTGRNAACTDELRESGGWDWGVEIGFTLGRETQDKGYAQEALQVLIDSLFQHSGVNCVLNKYLN